MFGKEALQSVDGRTLHAHVRIDIPAVHTRLALDIVVGHIESARISHPSVYHHNLAVVAQHAVHVREDIGRIDADVNAVGAQLFQTLSVVVAAAHVVIAVNHEAHLDAFGGLLPHHFNHAVANAVVGKDKVLAVDVVAGRQHVAEQRRKLLRAALIEAHRIACP